MRFIRNTIVSTDGELKKRDSRRGECQKCDKALHQVPGFGVTSVTSKVRRSAPSYINQLRFTNHPILLFFIHLIEVKSTENCGTKISRRSAQCEISQFSMEITQFTLILVRLLAFYPTAMVYSRNLHHLLYCELDFTLTNVVAPAVVNFLSPNSLVNFSQIQYFCQLLSSK